MCIYLRKFDMIFVYEFVDLKSRLTFDKLFRTQIKNLILCNNYFL